MAASDASTRLPRAGKRANELVRWTIGPVFGVLAILMFVTRDQMDIPNTERVPVAWETVTTDPLRSPLADPPHIVLAGFELECMECHRMFESLPDTPRWLMQHRHIVFDHGLNDRCLDCHDRDDRNMLGLSSGETIPFADAPRLCAHCHGAAWRDWQRHVHGRTTDYWDETRGPRTRLSCVECHDPHAPAFDQMRPLPGPNTLRMGEPRRDHHPAAFERRNPLRHFNAPRPGPAAEPARPAGEEGAD
ncbi:MAG: hypothetical protein ACYTE6_02340 [Planctomycetota bacterium]|jgi:hypothetical protein